MKYFFQELPDDIFVTFKKYLDLIFTEDAYDNWVGWQSDQTIQEWLKTFKELENITHTPFIKDELI